MTHYTYSSCCEMGGTGFLLLITPLGFRMSHLALARLKLMFASGGRCFVIKGF